MPEPGKSEVREEQALKLDVVGKAESLVCGVYG